eukprot:TRINITY_DN7350_c0_g5_i1.p1 TRINITY_DN7350_c0_g5~~TRINITY_DN7350_c0_g5_i1.p1  ORF type:complete len:386 (-),score=84.93 TRINITY_DN7350_c0_g5_i1:163-1320(-)
MRGDADDLPSYVPMRPFSAATSGSAASEGSQAPRGARGTREPVLPKASSSSSAPRSFRPTLPSERRSVEQALISSMPAEVNASSLLEDAWRDQQREGDAANARVSNTVPERFRGMSLKQFGVGGVRSGSAGGYAAISQAAGVVGAPRKAKERKDGSSLDLMDLAFSSSHKIVDGQLVTSYMPLSLPYYQIHDEEDETKQASADGDKQKKKTRPSAVLIDEANANAAKQNFLNEHGDLNEQQLLLMQLPSVLPELLNPLEEVQRENEDAATAGAGAAITRYPDGRIGKLKIYKSGKVRMEIAGIDFCVDSGCETFFQQDLACVCPLAHEVIDLGPIRRRVVITPDVDSIIADTMNQATDHPMGTGDAVAGDAGASSSKGKATGTSA